MAPGLNISIPRTSVITTDKPYTQYHIVLQLPLRRQEITKRYTDFVKLHQDLSRLGTPPSALPSKSWFSRTVNNDALTEDRRKSLEKYIKTIIASQDGRWRSSEAWRRFIDLPAGTSTLDTQGNLTRKDDTFTMDSSQWLELHRTLKTNIQTIRQQLKKREEAATVQQQHSLSADAKASLVRGAATVQQLDGAIPGLAQTDNLGDGELRRRKDLVVAARKEIQGLEGILKTTKLTQVEVPDVNKEALWKGTTSKPGRVLGGPLKETVRTRELDNDGVLQLQQQIMKEQDEDVMALGQVVGRLKDMGILINEELETQIDMLNLVEQDADRVQGKIDVGRSRIKKIK